MDPTLIVLKPGADLDALSSAYGVLKLFPEAKLLRPKNLSKSAAKAFKKFKKLFRLEESIPPKVGTLVLVDTCSLKGLERLPEFKRLVVFDHHEGCGKNSGKPAEFFIDKVGACTTLLVERLQRKKVDITAEEATLLLLGIYEDTGHFTHLGTTPRDLRAAAYLLERGADLKTVEEIVREKLSAQDLEVVRSLLRSIEYINTPEGFRIAVALLRGEDYHPEFQELVYELKEFTENVDAFFVIYEAGGKTYLFGRAVNTGFDVAKVLKKLGGGGHKEASSLKLSNISAERVKRRLLEVLLQNESSLWVKNFYSSPPLVIRDNTPLKEALQKLVDFGFAGAPVVDGEGKPVGLIFKKDILKALKHLPETTKVSEIAQTDFQTLRETDTVWKAEELLVRFGQKLIPVVDESGKVVGVLSRLDIFKNIKSEFPEPKPGRKIKLPENIEDIAKKIGQIADELDVKAYIVGGVVRDILLEKPVWDLDVVVEGDALGLAKRLAEVYGVKLHPFERFGTAHMKIGDLKLEFAAARRETYKKSGDYPTVEPASLKEDILRRDFTINTLALSLNGKDFGRLIDLVGGEEDLRNGVIRILHPLSFVEDPVRILRALRFAGRFGFELSKGTRSLLKRAVELGLLKKAPPGRIANEIRLALREEKLPEIFRLYRKFGVFKELFPEGLRINSATEEELFKLKNHLESFGVKKTGWLMLVYLLSQLPFERAEEFLKRTGAPSKVMEILKQYTEGSGEIVKTLLSAKPYELVKKLKKFHDETVILSVFKHSPKVVNLARFYLSTLKTAKVSVPVEELKRQGLKGKELGREIERLKEREFNRLWEEKLSELRQ